MLPTFRSVALVAAAVAVLVGPWVQAAQQDTPERVLQGKGLREMGSHLYVLPTERDFEKTLAPIVKQNPMKRLGGAVKEQQDTDARREWLEFHEAPRLIEQRRLAKGDMDRAQDSGAPPDVYNRLVTRYNDLSDRMRELDLELRDLAKRSKTLSENAAKQREQFVQSLLDLRSIADKIQGQYAALARDPDVKAALAALNTNRKTQAEITLGPSNTFLQGLKNLAKFEKAVLTESVDLRGDRGVFWVDAVLNQNHPKPMLVDTGAALVILPADLASEIGIRSKTGDRSIQLKLADGRTVEARMARMKALRVGKFSAENVECAVLPEGLEEAVPLLGQTFLQRFSYRIDTDARKLTLWKLDLPTEEGGLGRKVEPRRGRG